MKNNAKKTVVFDLWETLIFGTKDSTISLFYKGVTGDVMSNEQQRLGMLISDPDPRRFLEKFIHIVTPPNASAMLLSLENSKSPLHSKIVNDFIAAIEKDMNEIRWAPGAVELLEQLKFKYNLILVSNFWSYQKKYLLQRLNINKYFHKCLFSCDLGIDKDGMLKDFTKITKVPTRDVVYVGRSYEHDIVPAVNANISALKIANEDNIIIPEKIITMIEEDFGEKKAMITEKACSANKKQKALIVIPPFYKLLGSHNNRLNLMASHLSAHLSCSGHENKIYHCDSERHENYITRHQMVFNSIEFYDAMEKDGAYQEFEDYFRKNISDIVFVTSGDVLNPSFDSGNWDSTKKIALIVRRVNPGAYIVAIGPEVGGASEDFDLIVHGEVEQLTDVIMKKRIRGRVTGELLPEEKLKDFPLFDIKNMATEISPKSLDTIMWRRGCSGTCDFCRVAQVNRGSIRYRSIDSVMGEIKTRYSDFGIKNFYIVDANFTSSKDRVIKFCQRLKKEFPDISWRTESRFDTLDKDLLVEMKKAGCTHLKLGLENALSEKFQVKSKRVSLDNASMWIAEIQKTGLKCVVYLMLGGKWFTHEQYKEMYKNAKSLNADGYTVSFFNPYPSTPAGISYQEWTMRRFTGSHLDIRLVDYWRIPTDIVDAFFALELKKGREDKNVRNFL